MKRCACHEIHRPCLRKCCACVARQHTNPKISAAPQRERSFEERCVSCEAVATSHAPARTHVPTIKKRTLVSKKSILVQGFLKKHSANLRASVPASKMHLSPQNAHGATTRAHAPARTHVPASKNRKCARRHNESARTSANLISRETVASKTTVCAQGQQFEREPRSKPALTLTVRTP